MTLYCSICKARFKHEDEVRFTADAYWNEIGSNTVYSISKPHNVLRDSLAHTACDETDAVSEI